MRRWWFGIHKWVGLVMGVQVLAWMVSGLFMTFVPIKQVRSEHNIREAAVLDLHTQVDVISPAQAVTAVPGTVTRIELGEMLGTAVWRADIKGKPAAVIDAHSGKVMSPLDEATSKRIAQADFAGSGKIVSTRLIVNDPPIEYRGALPVWQFMLDDESNTHLYVSPVTGKVVARRSDIWRMYDFLWSLHIMDYQTRDNFNNWAVIIAALVGLGLTITGFGILAYRFWPKPSAR